MIYHGKEYVNTKMCVWLADRYGRRSRYWHRVFEDKDGQYIKLDGRMAKLEEFNISAIGNL